MKKLLSFALAIVMAFSLVACGGETSSENSEVKETVTYQSIYDEYSDKLKEATDSLVEEFKTEAAELSDTTEIAELVNKKYEELAEICNDGVTKMAELMDKNGDEYSVYEDWALELTNVYTEQAQVLTEAYLNIGLS